MSEQAGTRPDGRTLGSELRGARLGFRWMPEVRGYVRLADASETSFRIDVAPPDGLPGGRARFSPEFRVWWERAALEEGELEAMILRVLVGDGRVKRLRRHVAFVVGMDGGFLAWA